MYSLIIILVLLAAVLMCGVVLIQESKGGGLASSFSAQNSVLGVRKTTDVLEKATWGIAAAIVILSVVSAAFVTKTTAEDAPINITTPAQQQTGAENVPTFPATGNTEAPAK